MSSRTPHRAPQQVNSVIAEIRGNEKPDEWIMTCCRAFQYSTVWVDMTHYDEIHHKSSDTYDKVDALDFKAGSAIVAVTAWTIANGPKPIAPHIDHAAVADILKKAELDQMLAVIGQWKP